MKDAGASTRRADEATATVEQLLGKARNSPMRSAAALVLGLLVAAALRRGRPAPAPPPARAATVTFNVDDASEPPDSNPADGACHTASNTCTLRAALQQATAPSANTFVINLKAATYSVSATLPTIN